MRERSLLESFNYAFEGIVYVFKTQRNLKIHFGVGFVVLLISLFFDLSRVEFIALLFSISLVILSEMINSAIESAIDLVATTRDPLAKVAKDVAAGAVLVASFNALIVGYLVFFNRLNPITIRVLEKIRRSPVYVTGVSFILVCILTVVGKSITGGKSIFRGGWPSGHSALASVLFTAIAFLSKDYPYGALVATLGFFLAFLVFQSRVEKRIHTWFQVISGAILGFLITTLLFQIFY